MPSPTKPTETMAAAIKALAAAGGEGAIDKFGRVVAAGEVMVKTCPDNDPFAPVTWLRLMTLGLVEAAGPYRVKLTAAGMAVAGDQ